MKNTAKVIFHIDLNMFFCSVHVINNPHLKGKAFAVGRENSHKGVVSSASYEARKYGIHAAMPIVEAYRKLPSLIVVGSDFNEYSKYHRYFVSLIREYSSLIEVASIDELYVDMTDLCNKRSAIDIAKEIQTRLVKEYKLPCSIGIAPTLFLAKMASDIKKPLGITILRKRDVFSFLYPLDVADIFGIGKKTYPKLKDIGINTIGDFMDESNKYKVIDVLGFDRYMSSYNSILGNSSNVVDPNRYSNNESISLSKTFDAYLEDYDDILIEFRRMTSNLYKRLKEKKLMTKTITITLRDKSFKTINRSKTIDYTDNLYYLYDIVENLLDDNYHEQSIRLIGVCFSNLRNSNEVNLEYNLFTYQSFIEKEEKINDIIDKINKKYGKCFIKKGIND